MGEFDYVVDWGSTGDPQGNVSNSPQTDVMNQMPR